MCARSWVPATGSTLSPQCSTLQLKVLYNFQKLENNKDCSFRDLESSCWKPPLGVRKQVSLESGHTSAHVCADCTASPIGCERWARPYEGQKWKPRSEKGWWWRMEVKKKSLRATRLHPSYLFLTIISIVLSTACLPGWCVKLISIAYKEIRGRNWELVGVGWGWGVVFVYRKCEVNNFNLVLTLICGCECRAAANTRQSLAAYLREYKTERIRGTSVLMMLTTFRVVCNHHVAKRRTCALREAPPLYQDIIGWNQEFWWGWNISFASFQSARPFYI